MPAFRLKLDFIRSVLPEHSQRGEGCDEIQGIASLEEAGARDLSFLSNVKNAARLENSQAGIVLVPRDYSGEPRPGQVLLALQNPSLGLALVCEEVERQMWPRPRPGIHPSAVISPEAHISDEASVGPLCVVEAGAIIEAGAILDALVFVGPRVTIGARTRVYPHVTLQHGTVVGQDCILYSGCVLGSDGFGYESGADGHRKIPQIGDVALGNKVEIGANSTLDRARFSTTRVGDGTKIDNLVMIGHNVTVGKHCFICACVGIAGSVKIGDFVTLAGQVGIVGHVEIGDGSQVGGQAGVTKSLPPKSYVIGNPAMPFHQDRRLNALYRKLPQLFERVKELENAMESADRQLT